MPSPLRAYNQVDPSRGLPAGAPVAGPVEPTQAQIARQGKTEAGGGAGGSKRGGRSMLQDYLNQALKTGFPQYGGQFTAGMSPQEQQLMSMLFGSNGSGGAFGTAVGALSNIAQQDSLGRAQMLLQPSRQRAIEEMTRQTRERMALGNNLFSTGAQEVEGRNVGGVMGQFDATLAGLMPQLDSIRMGAAQAIPGLFAQGESIAGIPRGIQQNDLNARYQEFMRTNPAGGPLQALLQLFSNKPSFQTGTQTTGGSDWTQTLASLTPLLAAFI